MSFESHRFTIGNFKCIAFSDGNFTYKSPMFPPPSTFLFCNAPKIQLEEILRKHNLQSKKWVEWVSPYICLIMDTGEYKVLIDTGAGDLGPETGKLLKNMRAEEVRPEEISTIILTHGHPDHIGGNIINGKLAFPNARFFIGREEWDFWTSEPTKLKGDEHVKELLLKSARKNLLPIRDKLHFVDREKEVESGISAILAPGHTPGHMAVAISSKSDRLLCIGDAILHPIHVEKPEWHATVDILPEQLTKTRNKLFKRATEEESLVLAFHFPFPGLGNVIKKNGQWKWKPI